MNEISELCRLDLEAVDIVQKLIDNNNTIILFHRCSKDFRYLNGTRSLKLYVDKLENGMIYFNFEP